MGRRSHAIFIICLVVAVGTLPLKGDPIGDQQKVLADHGLARAGSQYLLDVDRNLPDRLRAIRAAQAQLHEYQNRRQAIQADIDHANDTLKGLWQQMGVVDAQLQHTSKKAMGNYNSLVDQHNTLLAETKQGDAFIAQRTADLDQLGTPPSPDALTFALAQDMQSAQETYTALASDAKVKSAIDAANASGSHFTLGPSPLFTEQFPQLSLQAKKAVNSAIKGALNKNLLVVSATLNGAAPLQMIVDSGCSSVLLTDDIARKAGVVLDTLEPKHIATIANGAKIVTTGGTIGSLSVGPFTVRNVACEVLPAHTQADCLLGGSFLGHFLYQIDLNARELRLTQLTNGGATDQYSIAQSPQTVSKGQSNAPTPSVSTRQPSAANATLTISAHIDGRDELTITSQGLTWKHVHSKFPDGIQINGQDWDAKSQPTIPVGGSIAWLSQVNLADARIVAHSGRDTISLQLGPNADIIHFIDRPRGADDYSVTLRFDHAD